MTIKSDNKLDKFMEKRSWDIFGIIEWLRKLMKQVK